MSLLSDWASECASLAWSGVMISFISCSAWQTSIVWASSFIVKLCLNFFFCNLHCRANSPDRVWRREGCFCGHGHTVGCLQISFWVFGCVAGPLSGNKRTRVPCSWTLNVLRTKWKIVFARQLHTTRMQNLSATFSSLDSAHMKSLARVLPTELCLDRPCRLHLHRCRFRIRRHRSHSQSDRCCI